MVTLPTVIVRASPVIVASAPAPTVILPRFDVSSSPVIEKILPVPAIIFPREVFHNPEL